MKQRKKEMNQTKLISTICCFSLTYTLKQFLENQKLIFATLVVWLKVQQCWLVYRPVPDENFYPNFYFYNLLKLSNGLPRHVILLSSARWWILVTLWSSFHFPPLTFLFFCELFSFRMDCHESWFRYSMLPSWIVTALVILQFVLKSMTEYLKS